ncbi:MAG: type II secretion system F family protein [Nitrososphaerota archaeon]|nr:type II secretion system F family protein [Nitrososphaerota archaeon]
MMSELVKRSGRVGNPTAIAWKSVDGAAKAALAAVPLAAVLGALVSPWLFALSLAPLIPFFAPEVRLRDEVARRMEGVERELPFFSVLVGVLGGAGVPLYSILKGVSASDVFPSMKEEALLVRRDVEIFGMDPNNSLERLASVHPSKKLGSFLLGYTSKARSGGDVSAYLTAESGSLLRELEEAWGRYVTRVGIVGSMMITVFGVVPLLLMVVGVFSPGFSVVGLAFFTGVGVPAFTMALLYMAGRMQPSPEEAPRGKGARALLAAVPFAALGVAAGALWASAAAVLFVFFTVYGASVRRQMAETRELELGLSKFLRDLLEYKRHDYDLSKAVVAIEAHGGYPRPFATLLSKVAARVRAGVPLDEAKPACRSALGRLTFLLLGEMSRSGGGTVDTVFQVSSFADRMIQMRRNATAEMKPYLALSYASPLLLAFGVTFVRAILSTFGSRARLGLSVVRLGAFHVGAAPPGLSTVSDLLIVVSAAALGLIGAKVTDLTVRNTWRASLNVALAAAAVVLLAGPGAHYLSMFLLR